MLKVVPGYVFSLLPALFLIGLSAQASGQEASNGDEKTDSLSNGDWSSIRAAYEAGRHQVHVTEDGFQAHNPGQGWSTRFDRVGFLVQPDSGGWTWGLQLDSYGFEGQQSTVQNALSARAEAARVAYDWNANLQEWYINDARGLEHGFTLAERPFGCEGLLTFDLSVRGNLRAEVLRGGKGVRFLDSKGETVLTYTGLRVFDVNQTDQVASFEGEADSLRIVIDEAEAVYPLTIDPVAQQAYLKASNTDEFDRFGYSVAASGDRVVIGAHDEDSSADGVNGNQNDNSQGGSGAAYVFERSAGVWTQKAYLKASNSEQGDNFGIAVGISGDRIIVGAYGEDSNSPGINGIETDNSAQGAGAAYIFEYNTASDNWAQTAYLKASNPEGGAILSGDRFGVSVGISGNYAAVGAIFEDSESRGINGDQLNNNSTDSGAVYIFTFDGVSDTWSQEAYVKASNADPTDNFGGALAISGTTMVVGATRESSSATGVNGDETINSPAGVGSPTIYSGAAYVFERTGGAWMQVAYLKPLTEPTACCALFGRKVAIDGGLICVSAEASKFGPPHTFAFVFERSGATWAPEASFVPESTPNSALDHLHGGVAVAGDRIAIGQPRDDSGSVGIGGNPYDSTVPFSGAVHLFERKAAGAWEKSTYIKASNAEQSDLFGRSVALSGELLVVGVPDEDSSATGIDGNQIDNSLNTAGAAYVFDLGAPSSNFCGPAVVNSSGFPASMSFSGSLLVSDNALTLVASNLPQNEFGFFLNSPGIAFIPFPGGSQGNLCLGNAPIGRHNRSFEIQFSGTAGAISLALDLNDIPTPNGPAAVVVGETWNFQAWFRDTNPGSTSNFTDGISMQFQ